MSENRNRKQFKDYVTIETCNAIRDGNIKHLDARIQLLEQKIKSIKAQITIGFTVTFALMTAVQFWLSLPK